MRITGWEISGFGIFRDHAVREIAPGLSVFLGPNEAGKTTLVAFIRAMLFGFPGAEDPDRWYRPLRGGRHGGRLYLSAPEGEYVVERWSGPGTGVRLVGPGAPAGSEEDLARLLGRCDRRLFQSVFAFSLGELQDFATLDADGVRDRIRSAAISGAGRSAYQAIEQLRTRSAALAGASDGRIAALRAELAAIDQRLQAARAEAGHLPAARRREEAIRAEIARLAEAIEERRAAAQRFDRLAELAATIAAAERQVSSLRRELDEVTAARDALRVDDRLADIVDEARPLIAELALYRDRLAALPRLDARRRRALRALDEHLRELGAAWDRARLARFDGSIPMREDVRALEASLAEARSAAARAESAVRHLESRQQQARAARDAARDALLLLGPPRAPEEVERQAAAARRLRAGLSERATIEARIQVSETTLEQLETLTQQTQAEPAALARLRLVVPAVLGLAALLLASVAGVLAIEGALILSGAVGVVTLAAGALALVLGWRAARPVERPGADAHVRESVEAQRARAAGDLVTFRTRLREVEAAIRADAERLGLPSLPGAAEVEAAEEQIARARETRAEQERKRQELQVAERALRDCDAAVSAARARYLDAVQELGARRAAWDTWKRDAGVPADLGPQGVLDFFEAIRHGRDALRVLEAAEREARPIARFVMGFEQRAARLLDSIGRPADLRGAALVSEIAALRDRLEEDRVVRARREALASEVERLGRALTAAEAECSGAVARREALLSEARASGEAGFLDWPAGRAGQGAEPDARQAEPATETVASWQHGADLARQEAAALSDERDRALTALRDAETERARLEESPEIADLELKRAGVARLLDDALREWRVVDAAESLIREALARFQRERQPAVLREASRLFADVTAGRYRGVAQRDDDLIVIDGAGAELSLDALSRGTAEQLYLCLRLGLAAELAGRGMALPLVMDDILVNFDPERAAALASVLARESRDRQVLLFTCHPETADLLCAAAPGCGRYYMPRLGGPIQSLASGTASA